jgi:CRP-like cAMP-binding protein
MRRAGDHAVPADPGRGGALPRDRRAEDDRRSRRRRQGPGGAGRQDPADLQPLAKAGRPEDLRLQQIQHFFEHYKDLEPGKWVKIEGWGGVDDAKAEIGAPSDSMLFVVSGGLRVSRRDNSGELNLYNEVRPGQSVGEVGLILRQPRTADVTAVRDSTLACCTARPSRRCWRATPWR